MVYQNHFTVSNTSTAMEHPQPAFDLLTSFPRDNPIDENVFADWYAYDTIDAQKGDDIDSHPEVWEELELPEELTELSTEDYVSFQPFSGELNLNALAIGLGLDDIRYEPEVFSGLVYDLTEYDATAFLFWRDIIFSVGDTAEETVKTVEYTLERIEMLGLDIDAQCDVVETGQVSDFI